MIQVKKWTIAGSICAVLSSLMLVIAANASAFTKEEHAKLGKCAEAHTNLSKLSYELGGLIKKARKGDDPKMSRIRVLEKNIDGWINKVERDCADMVEVLLANIEPSDAKKKVLMRCYKSNEDGEKSVLRDASKEMKGASPDKQRQIMNDTRKRFAWMKNSFKDCIEKRMGAYNLPTDDLAKIFAKLNAEHNKCWDGCVNRCTKKGTIEVDPKCYDKCNDGCEKKNDVRELKALKRYAKQYIE